MSDAVPDPTRSPPPEPAHPTEMQRAIRAALLGAALGAVLAVLARTRRDPA